MRRQQGFSYVVAMFLVAAVSIISVRALENTLTAERREKEAELLWVGQAYRNAIRMYYDGSSASTRVYPATLNDLLVDKRGTIIQVHLRKLYRDPITAGKDWGLVYAEAGGIMGVYSLSATKPLKTGGFPAELTRFTGKKHYHEWQFVYP